MSVCTLFAMPPKGEAIYLDVAAYMHGKAPGTKAYHSLEKRVGFQRSSPQNNFRRIVACHIPADSHCLDTISYVPSSDSKVPLPLLLGVLNSKLLDWYFRLGSTNSKVNEYQFRSLPVPLFAETATQNDAATYQSAVADMNGGRFDDALALCSCSRYATIQLSDS